MNAAKASGRFLSGGFLSGRFSALLLCIGMAATLGACASLPRDPRTAEQATLAEPAGFGLVRSWADVPDPRFAADVRAALQRSGRPLTYLAMSGGGGDGAFGAGVLNGWSETGRRPVFTMVSGVSTGALIAPFAFLGERYDPLIRELYTSGIASSLLQDLDPVQAVFGASIFSNDRLRALAERFVTPELVAEVARERERGRVLLIVTTNLDTQRPVVWDMGKIAAVGTPEAVRLFRDVMIASASIPAVFPPVLIQAQAEGRSFREMHVDGTVTASIFTLPRSYLTGATAVRTGPGASLYILMNAKIEPDFDLVANNTVDIATRSFSTFVKNQARADVLATYNLARQNHAAFHIAAIDKDFPTVNGAGFDTGYMRRLYQYGYEAGRSGTAWQHSLPGVATKAKVLVSR